MTDAIKPYLVQRGNFKNINLSDVAGIDSVIAWDYMGAAEFEFGVLGKCLRRIVTARSTYSIAYTTWLSKNRKPLILMCVDDRRQAVVDAISKIVSGKARLKESTGMPHIFGGDNSFLADCYAKIDFWIDIENDWLAWIGDARTPFIQKAFENLSKKWST